MNGPAASSFPRHGGDLDFAIARYGNPPCGWLDLSTGINPDPYPVGAIDIASLARLPQQRALRGLIAAAAVAYGVPVGVPLVATSGSELALRLLPLLTPRGRVAVVSPTYGSHAQAWKDAGHQVTSVEALDQVPAGATVIIIGNPNNPDGRLTLPEKLADAARRLARDDGLLVVDEAFADIAPQVSLVPRLGNLPAVVLRSFGKFFGLPGLRLGFAAGSAPVLRRLADTLGDWPVTPTAIAVGSKALRDEAWQRDTRADLATATSRVRSFLQQHGHAVIGATDLFTLVEVADAAALHDRLATQGVWTRAFHDRPKWLRIGLPSGDAAFARLERALKAA